MVKFPSVTSSNLLEVGTSQFARQHPPLISVTFFSVSTLKPKSGLQKINEKLGGEPRPHTSWRCFPRTAQSVEQLLLLFNSGQVPTITKSCVAKSIALSTYRAPDRGQNTETRRIILRNKRRSCALETRYTSSRSVPSSSYLQ
ncbi:hypothetical protein VTO42DRAFT_3617 [Malbranchea cinnamomea]